MDIANASRLYFVTKIHKKLLSMYKNTRLLKCTSKCVKFYYLPLNMQLFITDLVLNVRNVENIAVYAQLQSTKLKNEMLGFLASACTGIYISSLNIIFTVDVLNREKNMNYVYCYL